MSDIVTPVLRNVHNSCFRNKYLNDVNDRMIINIRKKHNVK